MFPPKPPCYYLDFEIFPKDSSLILGYIPNGGLAMVRTLGPKEFSLAEITESRQVCAYPKCFD